MMLYPPLEQLMQRVDTKYTLVVVAAKRARDLMAGKDQPRIEAYSDKPVSIALEEIAAGAVYWERPRTPAR
jgi:DNA-directed RNA polymerase subunit omega